MTAKTKASEWKLGVSTAFTGNIREETFRSYAEAGVPCMEISLAGRESETIDWDATKRYAKEYGVEIHSLHLPFSPFPEVNIASLDRQLVADTLERYERILPALGDAGIPVAVVHPSGEPNRDADRPELIRIATGSLARLAASAAKYGVTVAVEDLPRSCLGNRSDELLELISGDSRLKICFDTNHLLTESAVDFLDACGDRIVNIHVSDYDFLNERHWLPGEGKLDWTSLIRGLEKVGYSGVFLYELGSATPDTIVRGRDLVLRDVIENHAALIAGTKPPLAGTPVEDVCTKNSFFRVPQIKG